jgi:hypothetical protein
MANLELFGQLTHRHPITPGESLHRQKRLMLLWFKADRTRRFFAKAEKLAQAVAKRSQYLIFGFGQTTIGTTHLLRNLVVFSMLCFAVTHFTVIL